MSFYLILSTFLSVLPLFSSGGVIVHEQEKKDDIPHETDRVNDSPVELPLLKSTYAKITKTPAGVTIHTSYLLYKRPGLIDRRYKESPLSAAQQEKILNNAEGPYRHAMDWLQSLTGDDEEGARWRLSQISMLIDETKREVEETSLYQLKFVRFFNGTATCYDAEVVLRDNVVESGTVDTNRLSEVEGSKKPTNDRTVAVDFLMQKWASTKMDGEFPETSINLVFEPSVIVSNSGKKELALTPFWRCPGMPWMVNAFTGAIELDD